MELRPGTRLRSQVDATEIILVRPPATGVELACGGHPMIDPAARPEQALTATGAGGGTQLGKRYTVGDGGLELLVTKPGEHAITADGAPVVLKEAKPLPASD
ncbi:hypothetical protein LWP59_24215 [Amycolatopsis acidiphila]|uniref:Uncharacterized protein n=1 Tax=Amycolatopsis acidiphila TaxID=715473 RepID=A0A558AA93_9PSEU|nr:hypothetical protein [Amycolatopsis acidiphila]TVT21164.1 hypothetical protein FNH06_18245 [Amycolatopsis acidiphila]UIJ57254.1 hypothetical protein LWP59_24215 [Amycolatopsis acidiphila]GHG52389.1 hypothetical protein GCM10017788_00380 [Amycolatopsis acidiphila]